MFALAFAVKQLVHLLAQKRRAVMRKHVNVQSCVEGHVSRWPAASLPTDDLCRNSIPEVLPTFVRLTAAAMLQNRPAFTVSIYFISLGPLHTECVIPVCVLVTVIALS